MRSKFSLNIIGPIVCFFVLLFAMIFCAFAFHSAGIEPKFIFVVDLLPLAILAWIFFGEFRTKMTIVALGYDYLIVVTYCGAGDPQKIPYREFDGYETSFVSAFNKDYEHLYLIKDGRKIGKLTEFYHSNYAEMKAEIDTKLKYLGPVEFNYWDEIRESFSRQA